VFPEPGIAAEAARDRGAASRGKPSISVCANDWAVREH
jgi:hypothetical protein